LIVAAVRGGGRDLPILAHGRSLDAACGRALGVATALESLERLESLPVKVEHQSAGIFRLASVDGGGGGGGGQPRDGQDTSEMHGGGQAERLCFLHGVEICEDGLAGGGLSARIQRVMVKRLRERLTETRRLYTSECGN
jgi:hypothetical protein